MGVKVVTVMRWYVQDEVNQDYSEQNEVDGMKKGADSTGKVMHMWKSGYEEDTDGRARVTRAEERDVIGHVTIRFPIGHFLMASSVRFSVRRTV